MSLNADTLNDGGRTESDLPTNFVGELTKILTPSGFSIAPADRALMSQDIWSKGETASFVASPATVAQLSELASYVSQNGLCLNPRGAGMSYSDSFTPDRKGVGILDFSRLDKIVEINKVDMYCKVQAGCTWAHLHSELTKQGLRTPFWGPMSGLKATVGGGLSQNNAFFGSGLYGTTSESVLSVTVVLADGKTIRTGTGGTKGSDPFFRHYGPDITGLFCGDSGALGYKAEITFRLIPIPEFEDWASFEYSTLESCTTAMQELMQQNIACELFGFDPKLQEVRSKRASLSSDVKTLGNVIKNQNSVVKGLKEGAKVALAGRRFMRDNMYGLHFVVEGRSAAGVRENMERLKTIAIRHKGGEVENSIPKILRSNPFAPLNSILGPQGERWVPVHGIVSASNGPAVSAEIDAALEGMRARLDKHKIITSYLLTTVGGNGFLIEPVFFWPEAITELHESTVEPDFLAKIERFEPNPEATALVKEARQKVIDIFSRHGGAHFQIGRVYPYKEFREPDTWDLIERIKRTVDAGGAINPGVLGLE